MFVTGEPGIGKTTVVQSFLKKPLKIPRCAWRRDNPWSTMARVKHICPCSMDSPGFAGHRTEPRCSTCCANRLRHGWRRCLLVSQSEREILRTQASGATRERMLREIAEAIEALTSRSPLLLVLEDLHWSDYSTLDLVSYLARRRDSARLMVIGTYRPVDVILADHPLKGVKRELQAHGLCRELPLECLD